MTTKNLTVSEKKTAAKKELELLEIQLKRIELEERQRGLEYNQSLRMKCEEDRLNLDKINVLNYLLSSTNVDMDRTIIASESMHKPVYTGWEEEVIRMKLLEIVGRL